MVIQFVDSPVDFGVTIMRVPQVFISGVIHVDFPLLCRDLGVQAIHRERRDQESTGGNFTLDDDTARLTYGHDKCLG
jgi:hypothetical protein